jgi:hypothetical protein
MTVLHTHPDCSPASRMETLQNIHRTCVLAIQASKGDIRCVFPKPLSVDVRY